MPSELRLGGVDVLIAELERTSPDLADETAPEIENATDRTETRTRDAYPVVSGDLRDGVRKVPVSTGRRYRLHTRVVSGAAHAHFYEFGTVRTRAHPTFLPIARQEQVAMVKRVVAIVRAHGLQVTGD
jgi:hypothetical protein